MHNGRSTPRWLLAAACLAAGACEAAMGEMIPPTTLGPSTSPNGLPIEEGGPGPAPAPTPGSFIAFQRDFQGFASWPSIELPGNNVIGDGTIHGSGKRTVYINRMPAPGSVAFETGTMIVKTMESGEIFGRVKRGGEYNRSGNVGWEWFELQQQGADSVIVWRGITPPAGFCYGGIVGGACNECHRVFAHNDFVATRALQLSTMQPAP
jgi:hypothetical protein